jgi:hypothetical protein
MVRVNTIGRVQRTLSSQYQGLWETVEYGYYRLRRKDQPSHWYYGYASAAGTAREPGSPNQSIWGLAEGIAAYPSPVPQ